jgi:hypothetical protein
MAFSPLLIPRNSSIFYGPDHQLRGGAERAHRAGAWLAVWLYACHGRRLVRHELDRGFLRKLTLQFVGSVAVYTVAVVVSVIDHRWGLAICTGLTLLYLLPPRTPVYRPDGGTSAQIQHAPGDPGWHKE